MFYFNFLTFLIVYFIYGLIRTVKYENIRP